MAPLSKVVIIDDDPLAIDVLREALARHDEIYVAATATDAVAGRTAILTQRPDLLFLDIELPPVEGGEENGLDFLQSLRPQVAWGMRVVFYTSYEKYLLQALRAAAFDYLLKPLDEAELTALLDRYAGRRTDDLQRVDAAIRDLRRARPLLLTNEEGEKVVVRPHSVGYFSYNSGRKTWEAVLADGRHVLLKHNTTAEAILDYGNEFVRIHKMYIINVGYLSVIREGELSLAYPFHKVEGLKVSKMYRNVLLARFSDS